MAIPESEEQRPDDVGDLVRPAREADIATVNAKYARLTADDGPWSAPDDAEQRAILAALGLGSAAASGTAPHPGALEIVELSEEVSCCAMGPNDGGLDHCGLCGTPFAASTGTLPTD